MSQHMDALAKANETRLSRSRVKKAIREGQVSVGEAMGLSCCQTMTIFQLLCAQRGWGSSSESASVKGTKAMALLSSEQITPYRRVGELTGRQRGLIAEATR